MSTSAEKAPPSWPARLPFYYGWVIIAVAFVTMAVSVTVRTAFSLLMPPLIQEFGWQRGLAAGAFSFGFLVSGLLSPFVGRFMDRRGPRPIILTGVVLMVAGLALAPLTHEPWHLYSTLGMLVGVGTNFMSFTVQSQYLPNWFVRRRGLAISIAFAGVGVGAIVLLPWLQTVIAQDGWRQACWVLAVIAVALVAPLNLLVRRGPQELGLEPDGAPADGAGSAESHPSNVVDPTWAATEWTLGRAMRTARFWWIVIGYTSALFAWYAVQVHQTKFLVEVGFTPTDAAWALGLVSVVGIPGQIILGGMSDRVGREWIWSAGCLGFALCYTTLLAIEHAPSHALLYAMVIAQGFLGYALTSVMGPIVVEIFQGPHYATIFGMITVAMVGGGAAGPWVTGLLHDAQGSYRTAFILSIVLCAISAAAVWLAAPRKVRLVPGKVRAR